MAIEPVTREETFLAAAGGRSVTPPTPITRKEQLLQGIIDAVKSGGATPDVIENAVNKYLDANPVKPGATTEQAIQIEQNKTDIADLQTEVGELKESGGGSVNLTGVVRSVNGKTPDENGNVEVDVSGSGENVSVFAGKTALFFGDSLTEQNYHYTKGYHQWVKEILGLASYNNYGVSGYKVSDVYNKVKSTSGTAPLVFVMCGVNDQNFSVPMGAMGDNTTGTTYGALGLLCAELKSKYPTSIIIFITPAYQTKYPHSSGVTSYEVSKAIREVCEKYAIPVYDNFAMSGIYSTNLSVFTTDNCHWNDIAHEMVGKNLAKFVSDSFRYLYEGETDSGGGGETEATLSSISATYSGGDVKAGTAVTELAGVVVTAHYSDGTSEPVTGYTLSGTIAVGSNTITVSYGGKTATFTVTGVAESGGEEEPEITLSSISAVFNQGDAVVYDTDTLDSLKPYLTVTAHYSDDSEKTVTDYTLSGALAEGVSTITVSYADKFSTFNVTVTALRAINVNATIKKAEISGTSHIGFLVEGPVETSATIRLECDVDDSAKLNIAGLNCPFVYDSVENFNVGLYKDLGGIKTATCEDNHFVVSNSYKSSYQYWAAFIPFKAGSLPLTATISNVYVYIDDVPKPILAVGTFKDNSTGEYAEFTVT